MMGRIGFTPFGCLFQRGEKNKHQSDSLFKVVLQCEVGEQFGMVLGGNADMDGLVIVDIADASAASRWNASRPMDFLEIGQAVAAVNGKSDWQGMLEEFRRMNTVELVINRKRNSIQTAIFPGILEATPEISGIESTPGGSGTITACGILFHLSWWHGWAAPRSPSTMWPSFSSEVCEAVVPDWISKPPLSIVQLWVRGRCASGRHRIWSWFQLTRQHFEWYWHWSHSGECSWFFIYHEPLLRWQVPVMPTFFGRSNILLSIVPTL